LDIFPILEREKYPYGMKGYYKSLRADILAGKPIWNKSKGGILVDDTRLYNKREKFVFRVDNAEFILGTKDCTAYLARVKEICHVFNPKIIAIVRSPVMTLRSWAASPFEHLVNGLCDGITVGGLNDPLLSYDDRKRLIEISKVPEAPLRRALWWNYLGGLVLRNKSVLTIIKYEELVARPHETLSQALGVNLEPKVGDGRQFAQSNKKSPGNPEFDEVEIRMIEEVCGETARALGLGIVSDTVLKAA
jgi:hypothetical protein